MQDQATDPNISTQLRWWLAIQARHRAQRIQVEARSIVVAVRAARARSDTTALLGLVEQIDQLAVRVQVAATTASAATKAARPHTCYRCAAVGLVVGLLTGYLLRMP